MKYWKITGNKTNEKTKARLSMIAILIIIYLSLWIGAAVGLIIWRATIPFDGEGKNIAILVVCILFLFAGIAQILIFIKEAKISKKKQEEEFKNKKNNITQKRSI